MQKRWSHRDTAENSLEFGYQDRMTPHGEHALPLARALEPADGQGCSTLNT